jgi:hypothetical protein
MLDVRDAPPASQALQQVKAALKNQQCSSSSSTFASFKSSVSKPSLNQP